MSQNFFVCRKPRRTRSSLSDGTPLREYLALLFAEDAIRHPPKVVLVENGFLIPNPNPNHYPNPNPKPNFGYQ